VAHLVFLPPHCRGDDPSADLNLDKKVRKRLRNRIRKTKDRKTADRLRVVLYKAEGYRHKDIAALLQMGINQVTKILRRYLEGGE
jgi:DNA-directed RNA polymerase specialized sigma24 family protein